MKVIVTLPPLVNERLKSGGSILVVDERLATIRDERGNPLLRALGETPEEAIANLELELYKQERTR